MFEQTHVFMAERKLDFSTIKHQITVPLCKMLDELTDISLHLQRIKRLLICGLNIPLPRNPIGQILT